MMLGHIIALVGTSDTFFCDVSVAAYIYTVHSILSELNYWPIPYCLYHRIVGGDA